MRTVLGTLFFVSGALALVFGHARDLGGGGWLEAECEEQGGDR